MLTSQRKLWKLRATVMKGKLKTEMLQLMLLKNTMTESMMEIPSSVSESMMEIPNSDSDSSSEKSEDGGD